MANHLSSYDHHHKKRFREMKEDEKKRKSSNGLSSGTYCIVFYYILAMIFVYNIYCLYVVVLYGEDLKRKNEERRIAKEMEMRIAKVTLFLFNFDMPGLRYVVVVFSVSFPVRGCFSSILF